MKAVRAPRDYRSVGVVLDVGHKPYGRVRELTLSLWWWDLTWDWIKKDRTMNRLCRCGHVFGRHSPGPDGICADCLAPCDFEAA